MALTKISRSLLDTGVSDSSDATAITIDSSENVGIACTPHFPFDVQLNSSRRIGFNYSDSQNSILSHDGSGNIETLGLRGNTILFYSDYDASNPDGVERMRIDSSGNLLVGTTNTNPVANNVTGHKTYADGVQHHSADSQTALYVNRNTQGTVAEFRTNGVARGSIDTDASGFLRLTSTGNLHLRQDGNSVTRSLNLTGTAFKPFNSDDNQLSLGTSTGRWTQVFAATATIGTSDRNEKQDEAAISDAERRVAIAAKGLLKKFKFRDSVTEKGSDARIHFGIIAQDLQNAFSAEGLDASDYGMWCSDTWTDEETGQEKTRLGIRYSELLAFIIAGM